MEVGPRDLVRRGYWEGDSKVSNRGCRNKYFARAQKSPAIDVRRLEPGMGLTFEVDNPTGLWDVYSAHLGS